MGDKMEERKPPMKFGGERLLGGSSIFLFGRVLIDIAVRSKLDNAEGVSRKGGNLFLQNQYEESNLARIYAFSFEGALYELGRPAIFLVHGSGTEPDYPPPQNKDGVPEYRRLSRSPGSSARTGLALQSSSFAEDIRVWVYDKSDLTIRLDAESGTFERMVLDREMMTGTGGGYARSSGGMARSSGLMARSSGWSSRRIGDEG